MNTLQNGFVVRIGVVAVTGLLCVAPAHATLIVDQSQLSDTVAMAAFSQTDLAQSFQQSVDNINGAEIKLRAGFGDGQPGDVTIGLWDALPNAGGNLLASGTALGVVAGEFASVKWAATTIIPNTTYFLVFTSTNLSLAISGDINNPYPFGQVYANAGYGPFPSFDYTFQTFRVPEPASLGLLALGALAVARRKNAKRAR